MSIEILLMPAGAGKTEQALQRLRAAVTAQPFARVWVLVSGRRQEDAFRQRLIGQGERPVYFNIEFFNFYQLYHYLLNSARQPPRKLEPAARYGLLRAILTQLHAENALRVYHNIATTPGFIRIVAELIYELKQNIVDHEKFTSAARTDKDRDLALIYSRYQQKLIDTHLVDREGEGWLALKVLGEKKHHDIGRGVDLLLVDGYDQFTPLQASLLMLLAGRVRDTLITLAAVPGDEAATVGKRFASTLARLKSAAKDQRLTITQLPESPEALARRHADLRHLYAQLFRTKVTTQPGSDGLRLIEAPDIGREVGAVLRRVKRLLLETDAQPDDILIALRDWPRYAPHFATLSRAYTLPLALHIGESLAENPAVIMLLNLLRLHTLDFRRRELLDVLRSAYFDVPGLDETQVALLEHISQKQLVTGGREAWLSAIQQAGRADSAPVGDDGEPEQILLTEAQAADLYAALQAFFDAITPPAVAPLPVYVGWLDALIGRDTAADPDDDSAEAAPEGYSLQIPAQIRHADEVALRDIAAMQAFRQVLRGLLSAQELLTVMGEDRPIDRTLFMQQLNTGVESATLNRAPVRFGRVLVTTVTDARGLPHKHVFIPGLSEGIFPAPLSENPLYMDSEREALQTRGVLLEKQADRAGDDGLFYEMIHLASESLTLSRPTVLDGSPWVASHLWREVTRVFDNSADLTERISVGAVVAADEVASPAEALLAVAGGLSGELAFSAALYNWLRLHQADQWRRVNQARRIETGRASYQRPYDHYSGRLIHPDSITHAAAALNAEWLWSASQLNDYGICGFRFFAKRLLRLETLEEPEDGLDAAMLGTINHEILERTYREVAQRGLEITPDNQAEALSLLAEQARLVLADAPRRLGFKDDALWRQERESLLRRLVALVKLDFSDQSPVAKALKGAPRKPYQLEAKFGKGDNSSPVTIPITVDGQTEDLQVRGVIDRMDRSGDGVIVVDYKTGSTEIKVDEMREGRNFQMMVYLRAAQALLNAGTDEADAPRAVIGGMFWHIRNRDISGKLMMDGKEADALDEAAAHIGRYIAAGRRGDFTVHPGKVKDGRCAHYCEYAQFCRVASTSRHKPDSE